MIILIKSSLEKVKLKSAAIWIFNGNYHIIEHIKKTFNTNPDGKHYYASSEFIMRRENFNKTIDLNDVRILPYEKKNIEQYLVMLDQSFAHINSETMFVKKKEQYIIQFEELNTKNSFESFWKENELIGLYWRKKAEIEMLAVNAKYQRSGYGSLILTYAINKIFMNREIEYVYLYVVDWNEKGRSFYHNYGMELNGHSYRINIEYDP
jgi:ribosomal protein S18 acetylase RimI-like enzyme